MPSPDLFSDPAADAPWTPTLLARTARRVLEGSIGTLWVRGEISELKAYQSGHWYFTLRDAEAQVRCVMWRTYAGRVKSPPAAGTQVFLRGTPTVWEERGEFRLTVTELLVTDQVGQAQLALERVRRALEQDGLFDPARKRPLPPLPARIAVVTSLDGAALRDIITVTRKRWPAMQLLVAGTKVQGAEAEAEVVRALGVVNRMERIDLCILARGGGSKEDLAVFNSEAVCRALAAVTVPTISAIGHETDVGPTAPTWCGRRPRWAPGWPRRLGAAPGSPGSGWPAPAIDWKPRSPDGWNVPAGTWSAWARSSTPSLHSGCSTAATAWRRTGRGGCCIAGPISRPAFPFACG